MQKQILHSLFIFLSLTILSTRASEDSSANESSSTSDSFKQFFGKLAEKGKEIVEKETQKEKRKKHNQAVRILKKAKRKFNNFECLEYSFDMGKQNCLALLARKRQMDHACFFERIKELRGKVENAEFDLDETQKIDSSLNVKKITKQMHTLQAEYIRLFDDEIRRGRNSKDESCRKK